MSFVRKLKKISTLNEASIRISAPGLISYPIRKATSNWSTKTCAEGAAKLIELWNKGHKTGVIELLQNTPLSHLVHLYSLNHDLEPEISSLIERSKVLSHLIDQEEGEIFLIGYTPAEFANFVNSYTGDYNTLEYSALINWLSQQSMNFHAEFNLYMLDTPDLARVVMPKLFKLVSFAYGKFYVDTWSYITTSMLERLPPSVFAAADSPLKQRFQAATQTSGEIINDKLHALLPENYKFLKSLNRTILFANDNDNNIIAVKISHGGEDDQKIEKEFLTTSFLNENYVEIGLRSSLPKAVAIKKIDDLEECCHKLGVKRNFPSTLCYIYSADSKYFKYMYDINDADTMRLTAEVAFDDMILLHEKLGIIFNQIIEMFHDKKRRYRVLTNTLYHRPSFDNAIGDSGMGSMAAFYNSTNFPNIRCYPWCLADLGDHVSEENGVYQDIGFNNKEASTRVDIPWGDKESCVLTLNSFSEYLYSLAIIMGRAVLDGNINWNTAAETLIHMTAVKLAKSFYYMRKVKDFYALITASVDVSLLARQMQFFMTTEQVKHIEAHKIPFEIFNMDVEVNNNLFWIKGKGPYMNEEAGMDLGPSLGNNPLTELSKIMNMFIYHLSCIKYSMKVQAKMSISLFATQQRPSDIPYTNCSVSFKSSDEN